MKFNIFFILIFCSVISFGQNKSNGTIETQNFILENLNGDLVELNQELGEGPILLTFWATWCKPCKTELKFYNQIFNKYSDNSLKVFAISIDNEKSVSKVKPYIKTNGYDFTVLLDTNSEVARMYYARTVPYSLVLNKNGKVIYTHLGFKKGDELEIEKLIKQQLN